MLKGFPDLSPKGLALCEAVYLKVLASLRPCGTRRKLRKDPQPAKQDRAIAQSDASRACPDRGCVMRKHDDGTSVPFGVRRKQRRIVEVKSFEVSSKACMTVAACNAFRCRTRRATCYFILITIERYKIRTWNKVHEKCPTQFDSSKWIWKDDLPTLV